MLSFVSLRLAKLRKTSQSWVLDWLVKSDLGRLGLKLGSGAKVATATSVKVCRPPSGWQRPVGK
jgi:hypothetical protein